MMRKSSWIQVIAAILVVFPTTTGWSVVNPTPNRESKLLMGFEDAAVLDYTMSDPMGTGSSVASINTDAAFVAEGTKSLKLDLTDAGAWHDNYLDITFPEPIDIKDHHVLSFDVNFPMESLNNGDLNNTWYQFSPVLHTTNKDDETIIDETWYGNQDRNGAGLENGWNHFVWALKPGTDTKITRLRLAGNTNGDTPYTGPIYIDNIRLWKDSLPGIHADEQLLTGWDKAEDVEGITTKEGVTVSLNTDPQFIKDGAGSLEVDMTDVEGGWEQNIVRLETLPDIDISKATAVHVDVFIPDGNQPDQWNQIGIVLLGGAGGDIWPFTQGTQVGQWYTIQIPLNADQRAQLTTFKGINMIRNQGSPWRGPLYLDNLRAVMPVDTPTVTPGDLNGDGKINVQDATLSLRIAVGLLTPDDKQKEAGDVNNDGKWNIQDTTLILQVAVGNKPASDLK